MQPTCSVYVYYQLKEVVITRDREAGKPLDALPRRTTDGWRICCLIQLDLSIASLRWTEVPTNSHRMWHGLLPLLTRIAKAGHANILKREA